MTEETIQFLLRLLDRVSLSGGDPDLLVHATRISNARAELLVIVPAQETDLPPVV